MWVERQIRANTLDDADSFTVTNGVVIVSQSASRTTWYLVQRPQLWPSALVGKAMGGDSLVSGQ